MACASLLPVTVNGGPDLKHRPVMNLHQDRGFTMSTTFVAPCASVIGNVRIIDHSCVWYGAVIRGEFQSLAHARAATGLDQNKARENARKRESSKLPQLTERTTSTRTSSKEGGAFYAAETWVT